MFSTVRGRVAGPVVAVIVALTGLVTPLGSSAAVPVDEVHYSYAGATSVNVAWRGDATDLAYGLTTAYGSSATGTAPAWTPVSSAGPFRQVTISGLQPGTTYHYAIGGGPDYTFSTPPTSSFRFDAIGDVGSSTMFSHLANTLSAIASDQPSFVLMVGDLTYANSSGATQAVVDQHFNDVMAFSTSAAYMPAWGNHEWESPEIDDLRNYKGRLLMPNAQASPGAPAPADGGNDWGWFDAGGVRFIAYPEPYDSTTWTDWQSKASAVMSAAQSDPSVSYIVTYGHRPAYSTGSHPGSANLAAILDGFGTAYSKYVLNINGHSHDYERFQPIHGVTHLTVGAPSSLDTPLSPPEPRTAFRALHLSHLRVDVSSTGMRLQAVCDDASSAQDMTCTPGTVIDEYTIGTPPALPPATSYYVDKTNAQCSDSGPGSAAAPFCTIAKGTSRLLPGMTLHIGNGTYAETIKPPSGTASAPVTVTAAPGAQPVVGTGVTNGVYISGRSWITVSGLTISGTTGDGVYLTGASNITVSGLRVSNSGSPTATGFAKGMKIVGTSASTVSGNVVDHNTDAGIYLAQGTTGVTVVGNETFANARGYTRAAPGIDLRASGNVVIGNRTHDNEDSGIQLYPGGDNNLIVNNATWNNGDHGIDDYGAANNRIIGNSVYRNVTAGINLEGGSTGGTVVNNISVDNGINSPRTVGNIRVDASAQAGTVVNSNVVFLHGPGAQYVWGTTNYASRSAFASATGQEAAGREADPRWADADSGNFLLTAGSPAIDSADSSVSGAQAQDLAGTARYDDPAVANAGTGVRAYDDRGAYEAPAGTTEVSPTAVLTVSPGSGPAPVTVTADASSSTDAGASPIASYTFEFGDGTAPVGPQPGATAGHQFTQPGTYNVTVRVTDTAGLTTTASRQVVVGAAGDLVANGTFETALTGWNALAGCGLSRTANGRNEGWAASLLNTSTTAQSCTLNDSPNWVGRTVTGTYRATAWVRAETAGISIKLRLREYSGTTLVGTSTATVTSTGDWQQLTVDYTVASPGSNIDLNVYATGQPVGTTLFVDDVTEASL